MIPYFDIRLCLTNKNPNRVSLEVDVPYRNLTINKERRLCIFIRLSPRIEIELQDVIKPISISGLMLADHWQVMSETGRK